MVEPTPPQRSVSEAARQPIRSRSEQTRPKLILRVLGALTLLAVGAIHLQQYFAVYYHVIPIIGPLFALNFAGATVIGLLLLSPVERLVDRFLGRGGHAAVALLTISGIGLSVAAFVFLFVSEHRTLFGFMEHGYRPAIIAALAAEAATAFLLTAYLVGSLRRH